MSFYYFFFTLLVLTTNGGYYLIRSGRGEHGFSFPLVASSVVVSGVCLFVIRSLKQRADQRGPQRETGHPSVSNGMFTYYMIGAFFVIMTNIASSFVSGFEEILNVPFFLFSIFLAGVTLAEIRKLKRKADRYDAETRG